MLPGALESQMNMPVVVLLYNDAERRGPGRHPARGKAPGCAGSWPGNLRHDDLAFVAKASIIAQSSAKDRVGMAGQDQMSSQACVMACLS